MGENTRQSVSSALSAAFVILLGISGAASQGQSRYGLFVGPLNSYQHGVSGDVYVVDSRTIHLRNFNYDGSGPAGYFYVGKSSVVGPDGKRIPDETGRQGALRTYRNEAITLTLPEGLTLSDISWLSVWCDDFSVNFGDIKFPRNLDYPKPKKIDPLPNIEHDVRSDRIVVVDAQTFLIPQFSYDGQAPDAFFWVGKGSKPSSSGTKVPDENGGVAPLGVYKDKTLVLTLPGDLTVYDIDYLSVWCDEYSVNFGHVKIPSNLNVPPSLRMLGVAPQGYGSSYSPRPSSSLSRPVVHQSSPPRQYTQYQQQQPPQIEYAPQPTPRPSYTPSKPVSISYSPKPQTYTPRPTPSYRPATPAPQYEQPSYVHASTFHPPLNTYTPSSLKPQTGSKYWPSSSSPKKQYNEPSSSPYRGNKGIQFPSSQPSVNTNQRYHTILPIPVHHSVEREPQYDAYRNRQEIGYQQPQQQQQVYLYQEPSQQAYNNQPEYVQQQQQYQPEPPRYVQASQPQTQIYSYRQQDEQVRDDQDYYARQQQQSNGYQPSSPARSNHRVRSPSLFDAPRTFDLSSIKDRKPRTFTVDTGASKSSFTLYT